jgi:hypothetical protein
MPVEKSEQIVLYKDPIDLATSSQFDRFQQLHQTLESTLEANPDDLTALYCTHILAYREQDREKALFYFRRALHVWYYRVDYLGVLLRHFTRRQALEFVSDYVRQFPEEPHGHLLKISLHRSMRRLDMFRNSMRECYEKASKGIHFQPSIIASIFDATKGINWTTLGDLWAADKVRKKFLEFQSDTEGEEELIVRVWRLLHISDTYVEIAAAVGGAGDIPEVVFHVWSTGGTDDDRVDSVGESIDEGSIRIFKSTVQSLEPGAVYQCSVSVNGQEFKGEDFRTIGNEPLQAKTLAPEFIGMGGANLNGVISGTTLPTKYYFRYGSASEQLTETTSTRYLPPGIFGKVKDTGENLCRHITSFCANISFINSESYPNDKNQEDIPPTSMTAMKFEGPFGKDRNHLDGIGAIDLLLGWQSAAHIRGEVPQEFQRDRNPKPAYPGEAIDLRDATFSLAYRSKGLDAKAFHPVAWVHSGTGEDAALEEDEDYTPWAITEDIGSRQIIDDGKWNNISFTLRDNSNAWSFCGSNVEEQGPVAAKYCYSPLGKTLRENRNGNICVTFVCGDELAPPEGDIEIGALELCYRSKSLLALGQGAGLVSWPNGSEFDPGSLTGGWVGNFDDCWRSSHSPQEDQEFVWRFEKEVSINSIKMHQNAVWPSCDVEIEVSQDGKEFGSVWAGQLIDVPIDPADWTGGFDLPTPFNFCNVAVFDEPIKGLFLRLRLKSGYRTEFWGLDAFEVFGDESVLRPAPEPCSFSEDIDGLDDDRLFVQLVAENAMGKVEGEIVDFSRPKTLNPHAEDARVIKRWETGADVRLRTNAMGSWANVQIILKDVDGGSLTSELVSIGKQQVARDSVVRIEGLRPGVTYSGEAIAKNECGASNKLPVTIEA